MRHRPDYVLRNARYVAPEEYSYSREYQSRSRRPSRSTVTMIVALVAALAAVIVGMTVASARASDGMRVRDVWVTPSTYPAPTTQRA